MGGVLLGWLLLVAGGRADEAAAVKSIEKLGGQVTVDDSQPGKPVAGVNLVRSPATDTALKQLKEFRDLRSLALDESNVTDAGLKELRALKEKKRRRKGEKKRCQEDPF